MKPEIKIFKFGGASVKDASSIRNVKSILQRFVDTPVVVIVSAMGKMTNQLERLVNGFWEGQDTLESDFKKFTDFHYQVINDLKLNDPAFLEDIANTFDLLKHKVSGVRSNNYHFEYDQIVSFGEILSTKIITAYLQQEKINSYWLDARHIIKTDRTYQEGRIKWDDTQEAYDSILKPVLSNYQCVVTQGFIGQTDEGMTTTLGREGSDFSASVFAYAGQAESVTIWKDVPGMLNADPRHFSGTVLLKKISFTEAVELAYYGASVIHPKTIQPLKNKEIPLYIKSFLDPDSPGTVIQSSTKYDAAVPSYIFKENQVLISVTPKDFSFVVEDQLTHIFSLLANQQIRINLMQNSAVSFSFLIDDKYKIDQLIANLGKDFKVKYNGDLQLLTIRHFDEKTINRLTASKTIILTQKTRETARIILK